VTTTNGHDTADRSGAGASPTLAELLDDLAEEFADVERRPTPVGIEYALHDQAFAAHSAGRAAFRLRPEIVAAAARTPDAEVSGRGREWVSFGPRHVDQYALDRAQSWFELAHRLASEAPKGL